MSKSSGSWPGVTLSAPVPKSGSTRAAPIPEPHEVGHHRVDVRIVHGEPLTRVVERAAEAAELTHDRAAGALEPVPRTNDERVATDRLPGRPLGEELPLDDVLRRDAC